MHGRMSKEFTRAACRGILYIRLAYTTDIYIYIYIYIANGGGRYMF